MFVMSVSRTILEETPGAIISGDKYIVHLFVHFQRVNSVIGSNFQKYFKHWRDSSGVKCDDHPCSGLESNCTWLLQEAEAAAHMCTKMHTHEQHKHKDKMKLNGLFTLIVEVLKLFFPQYNFKLLDHMNKRKYNEIGYMILTL